MKKKVSGTILFCKVNRDIKDCNFYVSFRQKKKKSELCQKNARTCHGINRVTFSGFFWGGGDKESSTFLSISNQNVCSQTIIATSHATVLDTAETSRQCKMTNRARNKCIFPRIPTLDSKHAYYQYYKKQPEGASNEDLYISRHLNLFARGSSLQ